MASALAQPLGTVVNVLQFRRRCLSDIGKLSFWSRDFNIFLFFGCRSESPRTLSASVHVWAPPNGNPRVLCFWSANTVVELIPPFFLSRFNKKYSPHLRYFDRWRLEQRNGSQVAGFGSQEQSVPRKTRLAFYDSAPEFSPVLENILGLRFNLFTMQSNERSGIRVVTLLRTIFILKGLPCKPKWLWNLTCLSAFEDRAALLGAWTLL